MTTAFSNHYAVHCSWKFREAFTKDHKLILCRKLENFDCQHFLRDVSSMPWDMIVRSCGTLEKNIDKFPQALSLLIERRAPLQQRRVSQKYCPWLASDQTGKYVMRAEDLPRANKLPYAQRPIKRSKFDKYA